MTDSSRFEKMYADHKSLVYNLALSYVHNQEDAQDITQEVFLKIYQRSGTFDPNRASLKTWVFQITINHCLDFLKSRKSKKRFGFIVSLFNNKTNEPITEIGHFDHPGVALEDKQEVQALFNIIDTLPDNQRTALILTKIEDRSVKEAAEIMELNPKAVESLVQRAKAAIAKKLEPRAGF
jgi:RNA polymerase sigma factor (sigma-70 family)